MKVVSKIIATVFALLFTLHAFAEEVDVSKLADSTLTGEQVTEILAGKDLNAKVKGNNATYKFTKDGYFFMNSGAYSDSGTWKLENGSLCLLFRRFNNACPTVATVVSGKLHLGDWLVQK